MNYSIHTIELRREYRTHIEFNKFLSHLYAMSRGRFSIFQLEDNVWHAEIFKGKGIRVVLKKTLIGGYLKFIVSLNDLLGADDKLSLIDPQHIQEALNSADTMLTGEFGEEFSINNLELSRVDYCINVNVESSENVRAYIKQLYRCDTRKGYKVIGLECPDFDTTKGYTARNDIAGTEISFYDKQKQLEQRQYEDSERASGILRIELRLTKSKAVKEHTEGCINNHERIVYCIGNSRREILAVVRQLIPDGDYYTMKKARAMVRKSVKNQKLRERMLEMLKLTKKLGSIRLAKKELRNKDPKIKHEYFNMMMEEFEMLNLNVVTMDKDNKVIKLPSLFYYLEK